MQYETLSEFPIALGAMLEGTTRPDDVAEALFDALDSIGKDAIRCWPGRFHAAHAECMCWQEALMWILEDMRPHEVRPNVVSYVPEDADEIIAGAAEWITQVAPEFVFCGAHVFDPACLGVWVDVDSALDEVDRGEDVPEDPDTVDGRFLLVSDHGNVTFLAHDAFDAEWREVWGIV